jgi:hypothetical protein
MQIRRTSRTDAAFETIVTYPGAGSVPAHCLSSRVERNDDDSGPHLHDGLGARFFEFCCACLANMFEMAAMAKRRLPTGTAEDA